MSTPAVATLPLDRRRGTWGMMLFIATEAALFLMLFFSYFFLGAQNERWPIGEPPKLKLALVMTAVLVSSSLVLHWGERGSRRGRERRARLALLATLLLGAAFVTLQVFEYRDHLQTLTPRSNAYGSIFYAITSFHALHLLLGLCMLLYALLLPRRRQRPPERALHNVSLYWHFVDLVWLIILAVLYLAPNLGS